ncbi:MAG: methyltransferase domain-containing protein [Thermodesulfobacteriota bacterium]
MSFHRLGIFPGARLLDLGCGFGRHSWQAYHYPGVRIVAADINPLLLNANRFMLSGMEVQNIRGGEYAHVVCADARDLPFPDASFDIAVCSEVLEHIPDDRRAASELYRVLAPGGRLGVSVPNRFPESVCWKLYKDYPEMADGHIRIYSAEGLCRLFTDAGFTPYGTGRAHALDTPYWWLNCLAARVSVFRAAAVRYKSFLDSHVIRPTAATRLLEHLGRPFLAKSRVLYLKKQD